jgi:hypothetical protein
MPETRCGPQKDAVAIHPQKLGTNDAITLFQTKEAAMDGDIQLRSSRDLTKIHRREYAQRQRR